MDNIFRITQAARMSALLGRPLRPCLSPTLAPTGRLQAHHHDATARHLSAGLSCPPTTYRPAPATPSPTSSHSVLSRAIAEKAFIRPWTADSRRASCSRARRAEHTRLPVRFRQAPAYKSCRTSLHSSLTAVREDKRRWRVPARRAFPQSALPRAEVSRPSGVVVQLAVPSGLRGCAPGLRHLPEQRSIWANR